MSRPKGLIDNACLGATTTGWSGLRAFMDVVSSSSRPFRFDEAGIAGTSVVSKPRFEP